VSSLPDPLDVHSIRKIKEILLSPLRSERRPERSSPNDRHGAEILATPE